MTYLLKINYNLIKKGCQFDNQQIYLGVVNDLFKDIFEQTNVDLTKVIVEKAYLDAITDIVYDISTEFIDVTGRVDDLYIVDFTTRIFVGDDDYESNMSQALISTCENTEDQKMVCSVFTDRNQTTTSVKNIIKSSILNAGRKNDECFVEIFGGDESVSPLREYFYN